MDKTANVNDDGQYGFLMRQLDKAERSASDVVSFSGRVRQLAETLRGESPSSQNNALAGWLNMACERCVESERAIRECLEHLAKP